MQMTDNWKPNERGFQRKRKPTLRDRIVELEGMIERLQGEIDTCRELRKYDRIEIERLRILLESRV